MSIDYWFACCASEQSFFDIMGDDFERESTLIDQDNMEENTSKNVLTSINFELEEEEMSDISSESNNRVQVNVNTGMIFGYVFQYMFHDGSLTNPYASKSSVNEMYAKECKKEICI